LNPTARKPFNTFHWFVLGVYVGIGLGIITGLIIAAINLATTEWPYGSPSWEVRKRRLSIGAVVYGLGGAVLGGMVGIVIGVIRSDRE
jgi:hypothetical protein